MTTRRLLIVGAKFGEIYLNAFMRGPVVCEHGTWDLAGLMANGSARARELAHAFGIPLFTSPEQLPRNIDAACVVVRSTAVGGKGTRLAEMLLERGLHVVQEHPVHPDEIVRLQARASADGLTYWVNSFYPWCPAARAWIEGARRVRELVGGARPAFAEMTTSRQLLYSSLDLILQATGGDAEAVVPRKLSSELGAFDVVELPLAGAPALVRLQTTMDPDDPDLHSLVMHRLSLGWDSGYLSLEASHGPVTWTPALHLDGHKNGAHSLYRQAALPDVRAALAMPTSVLLHEAAADWLSAFEIESPAGVCWILDRLVARLEGEPEPAGLLTNYQLGLSRLWQRTQQCVGPARERPLAAPVVIDPSDLRLSSTEAGR